MKFELTNSQIVLIQKVIERDLYNQTNQLNEYKICLEEGSPVKMKITKRLAQNI
jgi:hypothetical protein